MKSPISILFVLSTICCFVIEDGSDVDVNELIDDVKLSINDLEDRLRDMNESLRTVRLEAKKKVDKIIGLTMRRIQEYVNAATKNDENVSHCLQSAEEKLQAKEAECMEELNRMTKAVRKSLFESVFIDTISEGNSLITELNGTIAGHSSTHKESTGKSKVSRFRKEVFALENAFYSKHSIAIAGFIKYHKKRNTILRKQVRGIEMDAKKCVPSG